MCHTTWEEGEGGAWDFAQVSSEFKCRLKLKPRLCPVPDCLLARWYLLKLFHLHPGFQGCSEGVYRQVSLPSFLSDFTALPGGLHSCKLRAEHALSSRALASFFLLARASLNTDVRLRPLCRNLCPFLNATYASFCLACALISDIPWGVKTLSHLSIGPMQLLVELTRIFLVCLFFLHRFFWDGFFFF